MSAFGHHNAPWGILGMVSALSFHTCSKLMGVFVTPVSSSVLGWSEEISYILAIIVSFLTVIHYGYKFRKWLKKG